MKINFLIIAVILLAGIGATYYFDNQTVEQTSYIEVENFEIELLSGEKTSLDDLARDKYIIIHFWATWCAPCLVEFPDLMKFAKEHEENIRVLAIAVQDEKTDIQRFFNKNNIHRPENVDIALDTGWRIAKEIFTTQKLPESFLVNHNRQLLARHNGAKENWRTSPWIKKYLNKPSE